MNKTTPKHTTHSFVDIAQAVQNALVSHETHVGQNKYMCHSKMPNEDYKRIQICVVLNHTQHCSKTFGIENQNLKD